MALLAGFPLFPPSASTLSDRVDELYFFAVAVSIFFSILVAGLVLYFFARYKRRSADQVGVPNPGNLQLEILWSVVPLGIALVMFGWGADVFFDMSRPPADAVEYYAVGKQWMWKIQHPNGKREINDFHIPVGQPIKMTMTSEDVIHSFFVPAFRVKSDVLPGRYTTVWFEATTPGEYHLFCNEYCGAEHSQMIGTVYAMEPRDYEAWLAGGNATRSVVQTGEQLFAKHACTTCHREDTVARGPDLRGVYGTKVTMRDGSTATADDNYLRQSILNPAAKVVEGYDAVMPTFKGLLSEEDIMALIRYIKGMEPAGGSTRATHGGPATSDTSSGSTSQTPEELEIQGSGGEPRLNRDPNQPQDRGQER